MATDSVRSMELAQWQAHQAGEDRRRRFLRSLPAYVLLGTFSASAILTFIWALIMSLRPNRELFTYGAWALPKVWAWQNYVDAWRQMRVGRYFLNTVLYSGVGTIGAVIIAACTAYVLARVKFRGRNLIYYLFLISLMIPGYLALVPRYFLMRNIGLVDTYVVIFLLAWTGGLSFNMFLLINFFETLPTELEEAAFIDGGNAWWIFWRVMFPLARPGIATIAIFTFMGQWNEFMIPLIYLRDPAKYPLALGLQILSFNATYSATHTKLFAGMIIFMVPILVMYLILKDRITEGLTVGAIKG
ncbi:MAG: carbohydrate ABC transporter permease [Anaerolineae bacterium]|nr:carbohydrate ABC transporter permease [Anaerolineae bacterium]